MLARAYEMQENKEIAVQYYREALKANCECYEAFNRLISNFLITQDAKEELIKEMNFTPQNLWLKDFYLSRVRTEVRTVAENEGIIRKRAFADNNSSHLCYQTEHDESGTTPPRFRAFDEDMPLRKVPTQNMKQENTDKNKSLKVQGDDKAAETPSQGVTTHRQNYPVTEVSVMEVLK